MTAPLTYRRARDVHDALASRARPGAVFLGGGTNLVDLMRHRIATPESVVDVSGLSSRIDALDSGGLMLGAAVTNTAVAESPAVRERYPMLARSVLAGASAQIRNMATVAGNLLQRTRCAYFYDAPAARCNKRSPGTGCDALGGLHRGHAILGASPSCIATHPSDMCVALVALDAVVHVVGPEGPRAIPIEDLHLLPGDTPDREHALARDELIVGVELPPEPLACASTYRKVRDRASYAFALVSVAAALRVENGLVEDVRVALGGVATKPWRAHTLESWLRAGPATPAAFRAAVTAELAPANLLPGNAFKAELTVRTVTSTLTELMGEEP